jgi:hypothetical protein
MASEVCRHVASCCPTFLGALLLLLLGVDVHPVGKSESFSSAASAEALSAALSVEVVLADELVVVFEEPELDEHAGAATANPTSNGMRSFLG